MMHCYKIANVSFVGYTALKALRSLDIAGRKGRDGGLSPSWSSRLATAACAA